ncbi:hypothetical protein X943_001516 [Babesia divergens]|uniref:Uncharacterized protein n=1 Tax=Babesia divergens TaxID=32595 RepID=A0AAD9GD35_BABDI|nr:hypothetical protein X943_001516 [Babesia divergens]
MGTIKPWERVMYKRQPYPPNYISEHFLSGLNENGINSYSLRDVCPKTLLLTQNVSTMLLMVRMYVMIKDDLIPLAYAECATMLAIVLLFLLMYLTKAPKIGEFRCSSVYASADHYRNVRFSFVVYVTLKILQPALQTLTSSFSYNTVYDGYVRNVDALPMNCLVLVAILIASRFGCPKKVSAITRCRTFSLLPLLQRFLMDCRSSLYIYVFTLVMVLVTCRGLYSFHVILVPVYIVGLEHSLSQHSVTSPAHGILTKCPETGSLSRN